MNPKKNPGQTRARGFFASSLRVLHAACQREMREKINDLGVTKNGFRAEAVQILVIDEMCGSLAADLEAFTRDGLHLSEDLFGFGLGDRLVYRRIEDFLLLDVVFIEDREERCLFEIGCGTPLGHLGVDRLEHRQIKAVGPYKGLASPLRTGEA